MAKETLTTKVLQLERGFDRLSAQVDAGERIHRDIIDKMDIMMEHRLEDRAVLNKQTSILENGLSTKIAKAIEEYQDAKWEREKEERKLDIEVQRMENQARGQKKDRVNRLMIAAVPIVTGLVMWVVSRFGG